jgi:hypothetical protein
VAATTLEELEVVTSPLDGLGVVHRGIWGDATIPDLYCGWLTAPVGGQDTHFIFHIFYFVLSLK